MAGFTVVDGLDLGLFSDDPRSVVFYAEEVGLPFVETLRHSPTYEERFYSLGDAPGSSALKINYTTEQMPDGSSGYCGLELVRPGREEELDLVDPAGLPVRLTGGLAGSDAATAVTCAVSDVERQSRFLVDGLGARPEADGFRLGRTLVRLRESRSAEPAAPTWSRGFNYVVAFVDDIRAAHRSLLDLGAEHAVPPVRLRDRVVFSWVRDPGGNWLELVQPAAVAPLPDVTPIEQCWQEIIAWRETGAAFGD